jgi:hypothetical protein
MSISYTFELVTPLPATEVADRVLSIAGAGGVVEPSTTVDEVLEGTGTVLGTWVRVMDTTPGPWDPVVEDLGIAATVRVIFWVGKKHEVSLQQDDMIRVVSGLLEAVSGDAVLHLHAEHIWLLRRDGDLIVSDNDDLWRPLRLAMIPSPYRRATLAFVEWGGTQGTGIVDTPLT